MAARSGWTPCAYGLKKGLRDRFGAYLPPLMEALGLGEATHNAKNNRVQGIAIARVITVARKHVPASMQSPLLAPERHHRIDTRRSVRRREAGDQRHEQEDARNSHQRRRIGGRDLEE